MEKARKADGRRLLGQGKSNKLIVDFPIRGPANETVHSAEDSANIAKYFLDEGEGRLQEEAFDRVVKNKKFIEVQIGRTVEALNRDRLNSLLGQEVEREMMARNRG